MTYQLPVTTTTTVRTARLLKHLIPFGTLPLCLIFLGTPALSQEALEDFVEKSVIHITTFSQYPDYGSPWQMKGVTQATGSGFIIEGNRILTNAHVVSNAKYIEVKKSMDPKPYLAHVAYIGHDCDLAVLTVTDPSFFQESPTIRFGDVPSLDSMVVCFGYPIGGNKLSVTRGIVSRIDYQTYFHSGADSHLVVQVDSAINPGNSGGPVIQEDRIVGVAFQQMSRGENIGYIIPTPVIRHFLKDIEDGHYDGYPELGVYYYNLKNDAFRKWYDLPEGTSAVVVYKVLDVGCASGIIREDDLIIEIDGHQVRNDGTIVLKGVQYEMAEVIERKHPGEEVTLTIWRDREILTKKIVLTTPNLTLEFRNTYEKPPEYFISGGFVFSPLSREYLKTWGSAWWNLANKRLTYYYLTYYLEDFLKGRQDLVILIKRLPDPINMYSYGYTNSVVSAVDGHPIVSFDQFIRLIDDQTPERHRIEFDGYLPPLVLETSELKGANERILRTYGITKDRYLDPEREKNE